MFFYDGTTTVFFIVLFRRNNSLSADMKLLLISAVYKTLKGLLLTIDVPISTGSDDFGYLLTLKCRKLWGAPCCANHCDDQNKT